MQNILILDFTQADFYFHFFLNEGLNIFCLFVCFTFEYYVFFFIIWLNICLLEFIWIYFLLEKYVCSVFIKIMGKFNATFQYYHTTHNGLIIRLRDSFKRIDYLIRESTPKDRADSTERKCKIKLTYKWDYVMLCMWGSLNDHTFLPILSPFS